MPTHDAVQRANFERPEKNLLTHEQKIFFIQHSK